MRTKWLYLAEKILGLMEMLCAFKTRFKPMTFPSMQYSVKMVQFGRRTIVFFKSK